MINKIDISCLEGGKNIINHQLGNYEYYFKREILYILELSKTELILKVKNQDSKIEYLCENKKEFAKLCRLLSL
tara:strand:+ start:1199 stop:1420 length:222 start_codon:yes stop_codon:yes gene_type:complete